MSKSELLDQVIRIRVTECSLSQFLVISCDAILFVGMFDQSPGVGHGYDDDIQAAARGSHWRVSDGCRYGL